MHWRFGDVTDIEIGVSQVVRHVFPPKQSSSTSTVFKKLGSAAHAAVFQYFRAIASTKDAPIDSNYMIKQFEWAIEVALNSNFSERDSNDGKEIRECVRCYLSQHLQKIKILGKRIRDGSHDYLFPLAIERLFYLRCPFKVNGKSIWLKGKVDLLWLSREYKGVLIEEIKATSWNDRFYQERHALQASLYYYLLNLEPGLNPVKVVRLSYLPMLDSREVKITEDLLQNVINAISETAEQVKRT